MTSSRLEPETAKHPRLRPSAARLRAICSLTYHALWTTIALAAALLLVGSRPSRRIEWPWTPTYRSPVRYAPAEVAFECGSFEKCSSQPVCAGSDPLPCATRCELATPSTSVIR